MLKKIGFEKTDKETGILIRDAAFPVPFRQGLEFSSPARGTWNIVHTGMLIPQSHQIFVCACGCLRGVVLTAAEMNALDRYSSISISEENVLDGGMEELMIGGVREILEELPEKPRAVLLFISCQHFFLAYDQQYVFDTLSEMYPDICFIDCYMIPTLRKSGITPDQKMRMQMYRGWKNPQSTDPERISLIGSNLPLYEHAELRSWLKKNGFLLQEIHDCESFDDYLEMAQAGLNLYYEPLAAMAAEDLKARLGTESFYLSFSFNKDELLQGYSALAGRLQLPEPDFSAEAARAEAAVQKAARLIGDTEVVIDASFTFRPLSFARMLAEHGFRVTEIYADAFLPEEEADFHLLQRLCPGLMLRPVSRPEMRFHHAGTKEKVLAFGQKAAWFRGTDHFVNIAESGGYFGFNAAAALMELAEEAFKEKKDRRELIRRKGFGCESCI